MIPETPFGAHEGLNLEFTRAEPSSSAARMAITASRG